MKNAIALLLIGFGLLTSSCTTYYFSTVDSYQNRIRSTENGYFSTEKNDIVVTYSFKELGGKVIYDVYNASDDPLFIDLSKSTLIAEDYAVQHSENTLSFNEPEEFIENIADEISTDTSLTSAGDFFGKTTQSQGKLFIPPHSRTNFSPVSLYDLYNMRLPKQIYEKVRVGESEVRAALFSPENSPLMFRTYLTVVNDKDKSETVFEDIFYVSRAYRTTSSNAVLMRNVKQRGDIYYFSETNETARLLGWTAVGIATVVGAIALGEAEIVEDISY